MNDSNPLELVFQDIAERIGAIAESGRPVVLTWHGRPLAYYDPHPADGPEIIDDAFGDRPIRIDRSGL